MGYTIQGTRQDPILDYDVTDAATKAPMRVTILSGVVALVFERGGAWRVLKKGAPDPREPSGFNVPGLPPLPPGPEPVIVAELSLQQVGAYISDQDSTRMYGVGEIQPLLVDDPQRPGFRWVYVSFTAVGAEPMVLRYRVTLYRPRG